MPIYSIINVNIKASQFESTLSKLAKALKITENRTPMLYIDKPKIVSKMKVCISRKDTQFMGSLQ